MFGVAADLLLHKQLTFENGKLLLLSHPIIFTPVSTFYGVQKILEKNGMENALYFGAKETGYTWNNILKKKFKMKSTDIIKWGENVISVAGWGIFKPIKTDVEKEELLWFLENSTMAEAYGKHTKAVDHIVRGFYAGAASLILNKEVDAIEVDCKVTGKKICKFVIKPTDKFDKNDPLVKKQLKKV